MTDLDFELDALRDQVVQDIDRLREARTEVAILRARVLELERPIRLRLDSTTAGCKFGPTRHEFEITRSDRPEIRNVRQVGIGGRDASVELVVGVIPVLTAITLEVDDG